MGVMGMGSGKKALVDRSLWPSSRSRTASAPTNGRLLRGSATLKKGQSRLGRWPGLLALLMSLAGLSLGLSACGSSSTSQTGGTTASSGPPQRGGTLTFATALEPATLDPGAGVTEPGSYHVQCLIFDQLLELRPHSNEVVPGLAESWKLSANKQSATFHLRAARFSDGSPVTSEDVKFSFARAMNEKIDPAFYEEFNGLIASISTPNPRTVVLNFAGPRPDIFPYLTIETLSVISKKAFERLGPKRFAEDPVGAGSGPFEIVKWTKGRGVELKKNPHYWRSGLPYLNKVHVVHIPEDSSRILAIRSGQADVADEIPYSQLGALASAPGIKLAITPLDALDTVFFQAHSGPLSSVGVRQALNYATPTEVVKKIAFEGRGRTANGFIPEVKYWDSRIKPYSYDPAKAKKLLQEAGFGHGFDLALFVQSGDAVGGQIATILQQAWAKVGVKLHIRVLEEASFESAFGEAHYEALLFPPLSVSSDVPSADEYAINYSSPSFGVKEFGLTDPVLQRLIKEIEGTWDEAKREELFAKFQEEQQRNPIGVPLVFTDARTALRGNVEGFSYIALNRPYLTETWIHQK